MPRTTQRATPGTRKPVRGEMVLKIRELLIEAARALVDEVRPSWSGTAIVTVMLTPEPKVAATYPSERA
jgi:hypothetical protein